MPVTIGDVDLEVQEPPAPPQAGTEPRTRPPPDMARILIELRREAERKLRLWCD